SAIAAVGAWVGSLTWAAVGTFMLKTALSMGLSLLAQKLSGKKPKGPSFGVKGQLERGADLPQAFTVGKYATAGSLTYANTSATGDKDGWLTWVITLSDLPVTALLGFWVNGAKCEILPLDVDGWQSVDGYQHDNGNYHLRLRFYDGTQAAADDWLT